MNTLPFLGEDWLRKCKEPINLDEYTAELQDMEYDKGTKLAILGKETIQESLHSSNEASAANDANLAPYLPDPLDDFLNEEDFSAALDVLAPTPLMVVKPNGEIIFEESAAIRANPIVLESTISPTAPIQRGTKRRSSWWLHPNLKRLSLPILIQTLKLG
ncbi:hypothetical protein V6N11_068314 [Hibiscus sabdariffa]|uniref:Uncharacterized protein n=1 Tax=Hibiscus sabdariffa TaxID=183260 RepID=A0ABR2A6S8_9ROSI